MWGGQNYGKNLLTEGNQANQSNHHQGGTGTTELASNKNYTICSKKANKVFDVCQDEKDRGILIIYDKYGGLNQQFRVINQGNQVSF